MKPQPPPQPAPDCHPLHKAIHPEPYLDAYCDGRKTEKNPRGMGVEWCWWQVDDRQCLPAFRCPYGVPGDRLWVRETWQYVDETGEADKSESLRNRLGKTAPFRGAQGDRPITWRAVYRADGEASHPQYGPIVWRPSIHMPRWASRLTLEITSVRVERVQEISEEDARAEGVEMAEATDGALSYALGFSDLWDAINAKRGYGWDANPWVWVIEFERVEQDA